MPVVIKWGMWLLCWIGFVYILCDWPLKRFPRKTKILGGFIFVVLFIGVFINPALSMWKEEKAQALTGRLIPKPNTAHINDIFFQIGPNAKATMKWTGIKDSPQLSPLDDYFKLTRNDDGDLVVNTTVKDRAGNLVVEINDNVWRVANSSWEKNYTNDTLEVKDAGGRIVFQIRVLPERAELQAEWWDGFGHGMRIVQVKDHPDAPETDKRGFLILKMSPDFHPNELSIQPLFKYPAREYFGQFRQQP